MADTSEKKGVKVKSTQAAKKVRSLVMGMNQKAHTAKAEGRPVAYCMAGISNEILLAMDITPQWTENYAGLCAVMQQAQGFLEKAESEGYSNCICGYVRTGLGFDAMRAEMGGASPEAPDGGLVDPDMLLGLSIMCDPRFKWYQSLGRYMQKPTYCYDVMIPPIGANPAEVDKYYVKYQVDEFKGLISFLEEQTGKKMDYDRLSEHLKITNETYRVWWQTDQLRKAVPCPMPSTDHFNIFVPAIFMGGEPATLQFYKELYDEIKERVDNKEGVVPEEKYRLMWAGGIPPWHTMWILNHFANMGAVFAIEYAYRWFGDPVEIPVGPENPLEHLAWRSLKWNTLRYEEARRGSGDPMVEHLIKLANDYQIDGMVMHATRSCRATTIGQMFLQKMVQDHVKIPSLLLVSDLIDLRDYSEAAWRSQIDSFMETVAARKAG